MTESGQSGQLNLSVCNGDTIGQAFFRILLVPPIYTDEVMFMGSRFYCLSVCKVMMSACPDFLCSMSSSMGLGVMPPVSVPLSTQPETSFDVAV